MTDFLLLALIFLFAGVFAVPIAVRMGLGSVLGYLIAGIIISPSLGVLDVDVISIQHFAEFGVVMMLFLVGLELEPRLLWDMRARLLGLGGLQVGGTAAIITAVALILNQPMHVAVAIGLVLSLSSTAIVLQTLGEKGLMKSDGGQASFSVLLFQDIAVIPMLAFIPLLVLPEGAGFADSGVSAAFSPEAHHEDDHGGGLSLVEGLQGWPYTAVTVGAIAAVLVFGGVLVNPLLRFIARARLRELFTAAALLIVVGIALLMSLVGLSPALGTFLAGVVLANSEFRHELEADIDPFRSLLLGLFFMTVGASINFDLLQNNLGPILTLSVGLIAVKAAVLMMLGQFFGLKGAGQWLLALGLAQAGEFGFVLLSFSVASSVIPADVADMLALIVALSMLMTPLLFIFYEQVIAPRALAGQEREADRIDERANVIIAGHGRFGGIINRIMRAAGHKTIVVDYSSEQLERLRTIGIRVYFGDATRPDMLKAAGIEQAKVLVVAIDNREKITELVGYAIRTYPHLHVVSRAVDRFHVYELFAAGCRDIIRETYDSSLRAGRSALEAMGASRENAESLVRTFEAADRKSIAELAPLYDLNVPFYKNTAYLEKAKEMQEEAEEQLRGTWQPDQ